MVVEAAARRSGAGAADSGALSPWNAEVEGVQRSACARAGDDDARGASSGEGLQQAVEGVNNAIARGRGILQGRPLLLLRSNAGYGLALPL
jgi:hypothetical protein